MATKANESNGQAVADFWVDQAEALAEWTWNRLVNRTDVWGGYHPLEERGKKYIDKKTGEEITLGKVLTHPRRKDRGKVLLTREIIARHFRAVPVENVIGLHSTSPKNTSLWGATDLDWHGPDSSGPDVNRAAALGWYRALTGQGFHPLLTDSNGKGGFHLRILLATPIPTERMFWFWKWVIQDHATRGLPNEPEIFPKQSSIQPGRFGNWLRLPGRHHTDPSWSDVWDGSQWVSGARAIDFILSLAGDSASPIPDDMEWQYRVPLYMAKLPNKSEGQGRDDTAFAFLAWLVRDMKLADAYALEWANKWDAGNSPPKGPERLQEILANVHQYGQRGYGIGRGSTPGASTGPTPDPEAARKSPTFPAPIPASSLKGSSSPPWLWHGCLNRGGVTLLSALWKSGKTTLLAHLLKKMQEGGTFCGLDLEPGRVLYVTEESETRWAERRDRLDLKDHCSFLIRPFSTKPTWDSWQTFLDYLKVLGRPQPYDLLVFDTLVNLWPVRDENDASQVQSALMPLHQVAPQAGLLLAHHNRKGDGQEATASRGSGALTAFVDTIIELRRYDATDRKDRRRVLTGYGRHDETPEELVIELTEAGEYVARGCRREVGRLELSVAIARMLPNEPPGLTEKQIWEKWPEDPKPGKQKLLDALRTGTGGDWHRAGDGKKGSPFTYWIDAPG